MPFPALKEAQDKLEAKNAELFKLFEEAGPDLNLKQVKSLPAGVAYGDTRAVASLIRKYNDEASVLGEEVKSLQAVESAHQKSQQKPGEGAGESGSGNAGDDGQKGIKSIGQHFVESQAYKGKTGSGTGPEAHLDMELKTLMTTSAGWTPQNIRTGEVIPFPTRPIQVTDLIPATTTTQAAVAYMEETTFTNAAVETAEGGTYQEAALALTERTSIVRKIAVFLPITDEQLEDIPQAQGYIDNRLPFMVRQKLDAQILVGSGTPPALTGILNVGSIQTQAKAADPTPDAVYKGMIKVRVVGRAQPGGVVFHPTNWQDVRLLRTADGLYIWGNPSDAGPDRIWGLQVVQSDAITLGTALVGDFANFSELSTKRGLDVQISNSHSTFFIEGKQALRADVRVALVIYRPTAFCTVTGL